MKLSEFAALLNAGIRPVIEFKKSSDCWDFDPGMRAACISASDESEPNSTIYGIRVDFSEFADYNKSIERKEWHRGDELVGWSESGYYPQDHVSLFWIDEDDWDSGALEIIESNDLYAEFQRSGEPHYVVWLEKQVLRLRETIDRPS